MKKITCLHMYVVTPVFCVLSNGPNNSKVCVLYTFDQSKVLGKGLVLVLFIPHA